MVLKGVPVNNETILTFNPRNLVTIVVMVTIGWFVLHVLGGVADYLGAWAAGISIDTNASADASGASLSGSVGY